MEWSIGEALIGANYRVSGKQAAYVWAMAEKRAKDRVILKLIELSGLVYSEEERDELKDGDREPVQEPTGSSADWERLDKVLGKILDAIAARDTVEALDELIASERVQDAIAEIGAERSKKVQEALEARKAALAGTASKPEPEPAADDPSSRKNGYEHGKSPISSLPAFMAMYISRAKTPDEVEELVEAWIDENAVDWQSLPTTTRRKADDVIERKKMDLAKGR
jgi:hypothetical protein